jgi:hypothetical protein
VGEGEQHGDGGTTEVRGDHHSPARKPIHDGAGHEPEQQDRQDLHHHGAGDLDP